MLLRVTHSTLRVGAALIAALLLGVILAACGGDDKKDDKPDLPEHHFDKSALNYGDHAPDFELQTPDGDTVALASYLEREQSVLLFFHMAGG